MKAGATTGGTSSSRARPPMPAASRSTPSTRSSSSTPRAPPGSRRASCTPPAATCSARTLTTQVRLRPAARTTSTGAPPTSAGSPATATSSTARSSTAPPASCTRARPTSRTKDRFWSIIERHKVTIFYTAPTAIRAFMRWGDEFPQTARPVLAAPARQRRRADQPRGLDVVPPSHRRRALPHRGHLVADRDGRHHDHAAARDRRRKPGSCTLRSSASIRRW